MTKVMSLPPPSVSVLREYTLGLEPSGQLGLSATGAVITFEPALQTPLRVPLGTLQLGLVEFGSGGEGRFPILKRLSASQVVPRERGVSGWLWTRAGGSALTVLGGAPNAALLFTRPLGAGAVACFKPEAASEIAARSPLGAAAIHGLLFRVADPVEAETVFRRFGLLRPLTDREVPPTLRRSLPTDRPAESAVHAAPDDARAASSVAPPGLG
jgi:hypothetical protein